MTTVNGAICLPLAAVIQHGFENVRWDLDANIDVLLFLPFLYVAFDVTDNIF